MLGDNRAIETFVPGMAAKPIHISLVDETESEPKERRRIRSDEERNGEKHSSLHFHIFHKCI